MTNIFDRLSSIVGSENIKKMEPLHLHTTFRVGGPADYFVMPKTSKQVAALVKTCKETNTPYYILGNGSNLLIGDKGYRGVIIQLYRNFNDVTKDGCRITAQAGALLSKVAQVALAGSLTGFEFAAGIPGTIGGACVMNAGAYGGEMKNVLDSVQLLMDDKIITLPADALALGYRTSAICKKNAVVLSATICLASGKEADILSQMQLLAQQRREKQPLEYGSAGSTFKRPAGYFAGKLIQDAGLRGYSIGGAQISEKHCGFVINKNHATALDIKNLITHVQNEVKKQFNVSLETEVKFLGEF